MLGTPTKETWLTKLDQAWTEAILRRVSSGEDIVLCGSPGIGKTLELRQILCATETVVRDRVTSRRVVMLSGSSEQFTEVALSGWLSRAVRGLEPVLLLVDDYNIMAEERRLQLLQWCSRRRSFLTLVVVASRYDFRDQVLLSKYLCRRMGPDPGFSLECLSDTTQHIVHCRGSVSKIIQKMVLPVIHSVTARSQNYETWLSVPFASSVRSSGSHVPLCIIFTHLWAQSTCMLIGDDMLSLRDYDENSGALHGLLLHWNQVGKFYDVTGPTPQPKDALLNQLRKQSSELKSVALPFVMAILSVFKFVCVELLPAWNTLSVVDGVNLSNENGVVEFDRSAANTHASTPVVGMCELCWFVSLVSTMHATFAHLWIVWMSLSLLSRLVPLECP